ncbi:MAG TPA: hypothetical protein VI643_04515, partial [Planctomycetota bacterium]|nr:hypothetical protein [Planctomycetota bacterium]
AAVGIEITAKYKPGSGLDGVASFTGSAKLPDGAVLHLTLIRMGYTAGVMSAKLTRSETASKQSYKVEVRGGRFAADFPIATCGDYRLHVAFVKRYQERIKVFDAMGRTLQEFEVERDFSFGTDGQLFSALRHALKECDASRQRIESAVNGYDERGASESSDRLQRIKSDLMIATPKLVLVATLLSQIDTCGLFYNQFAFEGRVPGYKTESTGGEPDPAAGMAQVDKKEEEGGQEAPKPAGPAGPSKAAGPKVNLSNLGRIAGRETALILTQLLLAVVDGVGPGDLSDESKIVALAVRAKAIHAFHRELAEVREDYKALSESGALSLEGLLNSLVAVTDETDAEKRTNRLVWLRKDAAKLAEALTVIR